jgi:hypothetical protein
MSDYYFNRAVPSPVPHDPPRPAGEILRHMVMCWERASYRDSGDTVDMFAELVSEARKRLAIDSQPAGAPRPIDCFLAIPLSEGRRPDPSECSPEGRCWFGTSPLPVRTGKHADSTVGLAYWLLRDANDIRPWDTHFMPFQLIPMPHGGGKATPEPFSSSVAPQPPVEAQP